MNQGKDKEQAGRTPLRKALRDTQQARMSAPEKQALWERIQTSQIRYDRGKRIPGLLRIAAAAAVLLAVLASGFWFYQLGKDTKPAGLIETARSQQHLIRETREVKLKTPVKTLQFDSDSTINYPNLSLPEQASAKVTYQTLTVPYGQRSEIVLSDGSTIWMNAGSQLTFPAEFEAHYREVYLEGEAYFDIAHDASRPFTVQTSDMKIKVLGTTFNLSTYTEDTFSSVYLLSGSIELSGTEARSFSPRRLQPGQIARLDKTENRLQLDQKLGDREVLWRRKQLLLQNTPPEDLIRKLERIYNTQIIVSGSITSSETFSGRLDLSQPLTNVLGYIYDLKQVNLIQTERRIEVQER